MDVTEKINKWAESLGKTPVELTQKEREMIAQDLVPQELATFLILDDGSVGFSFHAEGLNVVKDTGLDPEQIVATMHKLLQDVWEGSGA